MKPGPRAGRSARRLRQGFRRGTHIQARVQRLRLARRPAPARSPYRIRQRIWSRRNSRMAVAFSIAGWAPLIPSGGGPGSVARWRRGCAETGKVWAPSCRKL